MSAKHEFGGCWTKAKLERLAAYLPLFTEEMKGDFRTIYFDAFAGTGKVDRRHPQPRVSGFVNLPPLEAFDGSAKCALQVDPAFDQFYLVDKNASHCELLRQLSAGFPELVGRVRVKQGDANIIVSRFCQTTDWSASRAVFFLDPYGMAVSWDTLSEIAATEAADLWYLFPISATLRMLQRKGKPPKGRRLAVDRLFGERHWRHEMYHERVRNGLLASEVCQVRHSDENEVAKYFVKRLRSIFNWVSPKPLKLFGLTGPSLFHLYFASSIPGQRRIYEQVDQMIRIPCTARDFSTRFDNAINRSSSCHVGTPSL